MPFRTTTTPPPANPKVTVTFGGLMLLRPDETNGCEIGIHRFSSDHMFQAVLIVTKLNKPPKLIRLVTGPLTRPFSIKVTPQQCKECKACKGVEVFTPTAEPFVRSATTNDVRDFRWALNLREMHETVDFNEGANPIATLNAGVLYTSTLSSDTLDMRLENDANTFPLHRFSTDLAAAIDLPAGSKVELSWDEFGVPHTFDLPRTLDHLELADTTYTISLLNDPPSRFTDTHDEIELYYRVLELNGTPVEIEDRCKLSFDVSGPSTDEIPCMPVILNS